MLHALAAGFSLNEKHIGVNAGRHALFRPAFRGDILVALRQALEAIDVFVLTSTIVNALSHQWVRFVYNVVLIAGGARASTVAVLVNSVTARLALVHAGAVCL